MTRILGTTWGASALSAIFGAMLIALIGIVVGTSPAVTIFAAVLFGALLIVIVQLGVVLTILWQSRGTSSDVGAAITQEIETPAGMATLKQMNFTSLLTVAVVQESYITLFKRDQPLWVWEFIGVGGDETMPREYGKWNRYIEWALMIGLLGFTIISALLIALFINSLTSSQVSSVNAATLFCVMPAFLVSAIFAFFVGLFFASVIRRLFILYSMRADESKIV